MFLFQISQLQAKPDKEYYHIGHVEDGLVQHDPDLLSACVGGLAIWSSGVAIEVEEVCANLAAGWGRPNPHAPHHLRGAQHLLCLPHCQDDCRQCRICLLLGRRRRSEGHKAACLDLEGGKATTRGEMKEGTSGSCGG